MSDKLRADKHGLSNQTEKGNHKMRRIDEDPSFGVFKVAGFGHTQAGCPVVEDKENVALNIVSANKVSICKKLDLSEAEKAMDGAPQGEIFDVSVLQDFSLVPSACPEEELDQALKLLLEPAASWAEKHSAIESMRRLMLHNSSLISSRLDVIDIVVTASVDYISSLRSSTAYNSILCISLILENKEKFQLSDENINTSLTSLMQRTVAGPKFVIDSAYSTIKRSVLHLSFSLLFHILRPFSVHKNADTVSRAYAALSHNALSTEQHASFNEFVVENQLVVITFFAEGLTSKKTEGKTHSRKVLLAIQKLLDLDAFSSCVAKIEAPMIRAVVQKEILKPSSSFSNLSTTPLSSVVSSGVFSRSTGRLPSSTFTRPPSLPRPQSAISLPKFKDGRGSASITASVTTAGENDGENIFNFF